MSQRRQRLRIPFWKRSLDVIVSLAGFALLSPVFLVAAVLIKLDSKGPVFFRQERIGYGLQPFSIYKFRTMVVDAPLRGAPLTAARDPRITVVGGILRKTKIDELPQLINVLHGEMSLVGPRPEVRRYVDLFKRDFEEILVVPPGITDLASLKYLDDSHVHGNASDPEHEYLTHVLPDKIALAKEYVRRSSLMLDLSLILRTIGRILGEVRNRR